MTKAILKYEILNDEQLDRVAGGTYNEHLTDLAFFNKLGYGLFRHKVEDLFESNGVRHSYNTGKSKNTYKIYVNGEWCKHPHWAALGYILSKRNYPGFTGKWTDAKYVSSFMKEHFHITDFG